eukprot:11684998-Heterocapsa_arctica.AAC.1
MSLSLMRDRRHQRKMLVSERSGNFILVDDIRVATDRPHCVNLMHVRLSARIRGIGGGDEDS